MPAEKRPLPSPTPDDSAWAPREAARHTAASGDGGRGGASHEMDGEASEARQERPPLRHRGPRDGDPDDEEVGGGCGGGDGTDTDGESSQSASAGSMEESLWSLDQ